MPHYDNKMLSIMAEINQSAGKRSMIKMDMTPMVDLAFLLLTFFMLTTTLNDRKMMEIRVPDDDPKAKSIKVNKDHVVTLILGADDKIYWYKGLETAVEQTDYSSAGVRKLLLQLNTSIKDLAVFIKPSDESKYQNLVDILDEMKITEVKRYYLVDATSAEMDLVKSYPNGI